MNYFVVVLPMAEDGTVNRQILAFEDMASAKQSFHANCGKYFNVETYKQASVCILDALCNKVMSDFWQKPQPEPEPQPEEVTE